MLDLSICCIIKNEINQIERICKEWVHPKIEIIFVDTGSTDGTKEFLERKKVKYHNFTWCNDFSKARNYSLSKAKAPMVLWLDADDHLSEFSKQSILSLVSKNSSQAYKLVIKNPMDDGEGQVFIQTRLFPNHQNIQFEGRVHEELSTSLKKHNISIHSCNIEIEHRGYINASDRLKKTQRNHKILIEQLKDNYNDAFCLLELGNSHYQLKEFSKAKDYYLLALKNRPSNKGSALDSLEMLLGQVSLKLSEIHKAKEYFKESIEISPEYLGAFYELAKSELENGDLISAKKYFEKLLSQKNEVQSMAESKESLRLNSCGYLGLIAYAEKDFEKALGYFEKAYSTKWGLCVDPWLILESAYEIKDQAKVKNWQVMLKLLPNNNYQKEILNWISVPLVDLKYTRDDLERILFELSKSLNNSDLWKELKLASKKFDNWERCLQRLSSFTKKNTLEITQISQRILNAQPISQ